MDEVVIAPYDPRWPVLFEREAARIREVLAQHHLLGIEHFGSTAVPGLCAKPIIDILVVASSLDNAKADIVRALEALDYSYWRDNPQTDRLFFVRGLPPNGPRTHHIHAISPETHDERSAGCAFADRIRFRDYLRAHPDEALAYGRLKQEIAEAFPHDREEYTDRKSEYVRHVMRPAVGA